ncbi:ROK family transcriptional regulator [Flexivirga caeni]|uniref:ROK family transcriptional regulator n=1 Tax=Flexivirga caeni TaxID=2294115 RepID=A0A3M9M4N6_9MICO|nr:ROK family transcriptional regulator [Flexivirga caeni]RNI20492.1 ROK family transcriptional regulator [Flexivirga caeni]
MPPGARSAARPEQIRRHNLSVVLRHLHLHGPLSRPDLVRLTGLNRSTIGALVGDLVELGIVVQHTPTESRDRAGRPPYLVALRPGAVHVIAVDVDVARVQVAAVGLSGTVLDRITWEHRPGSDRSAARVADRVADAAGQLCVGVDDSVRVGVGVSVPAMVDNPQGIAVYAPNLQWSNAPFGSLLRARLGDHVVVGNDSDLALLAEHRRGVAAGFSHVVLVLGRVGVGGGVIVGGELLRGSRGYAAEIGHLTVQADGPVCHCGNRGCLEEYVGEEAILRAAEAAGIESPSLDSLFERAADGDAVALDVVSSVAQWLGRGLSSVAHVLNPEAIVTGGHLAQVLRIAEPSVRIGLQRGMLTIGRAPITLLQGTVPEASLIGAAELAFERLLAAPDLLPCLDHRRAAEPVPGS